jgi:hypothetical protein
MDNFGLRNEALLGELQKSGSLAIKGVNEFGVYQFDSKNTKDGIVSGKLVKPKYNDAEIEKSLDVSIFELIPIEAPELPDTVLRSVYNVVTQSVLDLTEEVQRLTTVVSELESKVTGLEIVSESLRVEIDSKDLLIDIANNQLEQSNLKVQETTTDLSNAIQKGIAEATQRVSLTARNESLKAEIEALNDTITILRDQLYGKSAEAAEGATVAEDFSVKVVESKETFVEGVLYYARANANNGKDWINGPGIEIENFTANAVTISVDISADVLNPDRNAGNQVSCAALFNSIAQFTIPANSKVTKNLTFKGGNSGDEAKLNKLQPNTGLGRDRKYVGSIKFTSSQSGDAIALPITLRKQVGSRFTG